MTPVRHGSAESLPAVEGGGIVSLLGVVLFFCGYISRFSIEGVGQLYWAELALPAVALAVVVNRWPTELFQSVRFRVLTVSLFLMLVGYIVSDIAAGTPEDKYLRGWFRVVAVAIDVISLAVICDRNRWALWWFWLGYVAIRLQAVLLAGLPLTVWKTGYGLPISMGVLSLAVFLPRRLAAAALAGIGAVNVLLDFRSLGGLFLIVGAIVLMSPSARRLKKIGSADLRTWILVAIGVAVASMATVALLDRSSSEKTVQRREASNIGRFAALRVGAIAIADSPVLGYGSWGQGTEEYARMLYEDTLSDRLENEENVGGGAGSAFLAHSQIIQAWMEGGVLAAIFFIAYGWYMAATARDLSLQGMRTRLGVFHLMLILVNLWNLFMSPFLGSHRLDIASAAAIVVCSAVAGRKALEQQRDRRRVPVPAAPPNLMR